MWNLFDVMRLTYGIRGELSVLTLHNLDPQETTYIFRSGGSKSDSFVCIFPNSLVESKTVWIEMSLHSN